MKKNLIILIVACFTLTGCINQSEEKETRLESLKKGTLDSYAKLVVSEAELKYHTDILLDVIDPDADTYKCYTLEDLEKSYGRYEGIVEIFISSKEELEIKVSITDNEYHLKEAIYNKGEGFRESIIKGKANEKFSCSN